MTQSAIDRARNAVLAHEQLESFEAVERISAGPVRASVRVRFRRPDRIALDYEAYQDPLAEFEEGLAGGAEYSPDEIVGTELFYDGEGTWVVEARHETATRRLGRVVFSPLPGTSVLGELGFLRGLTRDFLLRDEGEESVGGRAARRIGLKPKARYRSLLLKEEVFPIETGTIAFDSETSFPLRISFHPSRISPLAALVGTAPVEIEYGSIRLNQVKDEVLTFSPPSGTRVFREEILTLAQLARLPFALRLDALAQASGLELLGGQVLATLSAGGDRGYAAATLVPRPDPTGSEDAPRSLSLRAGNYLSHNMSRRRAFLSEHGERVTLGGTPGQFVDRSEIARETLPEGATQKILEVGWESAGVHAFLLAEGLSRDELLGAARSLVGDGEAGSPRPSPSS